MVDAIAGFFTLLLLLRFFMQLNRVSFGNQIGTFVVQLTNWAVKPLRAWYPVSAGLTSPACCPPGCCRCVLVLAVFLLRGSPATVDQGTLALLVLWHGLLGTLRVAIWVFIGALFLQAVLSWVNPHSPLGYPVMQLTRPILQPIQRFLPPIANIDLSPLLAIVLLQMLLLLL